MSAIEQEKPEDNGMFVGLAPEHKIIVGLIEDALEQDEEDTAEQPETEETSGPDEPDMEAEEE